MYVCVRGGQQFKERKAHGIKNNAITKFAEAYVIDMGINKFQKKHRAGVLQRQRVESEDCTCYTFMYVR